MTTFLIGGNAEHDAISRQLFRETFEREPTPEEVRVMHEGVLEGHQDMARQRAAAGHYQKGDLGLALREYFGMRRARREWKRKAKSALRST